MEVQLMAARTILAFFVLTLVGLAPSQLAAQSNSSGPGSTADESWVILRVSSIIRPGVKISTIRYQLDGLFRAADLDGGGLAASDRMIASQISDANKRATLIARWARWDLNGDGRVTQEEIAAAHGPQIANAFRINNFIVEPSDAQRKELQDKIIANAMEMDADGDGILTLDDVLHTSKKSGKANRGSVTMQTGAAIPEAFDHDNNGTISLDEFRSVVERVLARLDHDKDGTISASEIDAFRADIDAARRARQRLIPL